MNNNDLSNEEDVGMMLTKLFDQQFEEEYNKRKQQLDSIDNIYDLNYFLYKRSEREERFVHENLQPTWEIIFNNFCKNTLKDLLFDENFIDINIDFKEEEAKQNVVFAIDKTIEYYNEFAQGKKYSNKNEYEHYINIIKKYNKIKDYILNNKKTNKDAPTLVINNYKLFFELLRSIYEKIIPLHFERTNSSYFPDFELNNFLRDIWLRATAKDFENPEMFLEKFSNMMNDDTFENIRKEQVLGEFKEIPNSFMTIKNGVGRSWDESYNQFETRIYLDKYNMGCNYILPVIRYGIYEKDGEKICYIGSIQNTNLKKEYNDFDKKIQRVKYKLNKDILNEESDEYISYINNEDDYHPENISEVEPLNILSLSIFINLLHKEETTHIEVPSLYALDLDYHEKWITDEKMGDPYKISEIKTEKFIRTFFRIMYHYPNSSIIRYPGDVDDYLRIEIPVVNNKEEIKSSLLQEMYEEVNNYYNNKEENKIKR